MTGNSVLVCGLPNVSHQIRDLVQMAPYFVGQVAPLPDKPMQDVQQIHSQVEQLSQTMRVSGLQSLMIRLDSGEVS
jgi:hypothetical protein